MTDAAPEPDWNVEMETIRRLRRERTQIGPGTTPAVLVIDYQRAFTEHPNVGPGTAVSLQHTNDLLVAARAAGVPVIYLVMILDSLDQRMLAQRSRSSLTELVERGNPWAEISSLVPPDPHDHIIEKTVASGFYLTELDQRLAELGIDELVMTGTSTSGCVRATVVDAAYRNFRISVVEECCDDFRPLSGQVSLWDMQDRFADVVSKEWMLTRFAEMSDGASA